MFENKHRKFTNIWKFSQMLIAVKIFSDIILVLWIEMVNFSYFSSKSVLMSKQTKGIRCKGCPKILWPISFLNKTCNQKQLAGTFGIWYLESIFWDSITESYTIQQSVQIEERCIQKSKNFMATFFYLKACIAEIFSLRYEGFLDMFA